MQYVFSAYVNMKSSSMKKIFHYSQLFVLLIMVSAGTARASTVLSDSMKIEIRKVSAIMYDSGDLHYIDADALCDGLIQPGQPYCINYDTTGVLSINDSPVPYFVHQQYQDKLRLFLQRTTITSFSTRCDSIKLANIFDAHSFFRTYRGNQVLRMPDFADKDDYDFSKLIVMLYADKLIDTAAAYHVTLSSEGLFVNDQKLDDLQTQRYLHLLNKADTTVAAGNIPYMEITHEAGDNKR
jgi:hypothetical protein